MACEEPLLACARHLDEFMSSRGGDEEPFQVPLLEFLLAQ